MKAKELHSPKTRLQKSHPFLKFPKASPAHFVYIDNLTAEEIIHEVAASSTFLMIAKRTPQWQVRDRLIVAMNTEDSSRLQTLHWRTLSMRLKKQKQNSYGLQQCFSASPTWAWASEISTQLYDNEHVEFTLEDTSKDSAYLSGYHY